MTPELQKKLVQEFPLLYEDINLECGNGWYDLIHGLSEKLYPLMIASRMTVNEYDVYPSVAQVKEKYGSLRFYMNVATDEMMDLIFEAEDRSQEICEICGQEGNINHSKYWLEARCKTCRPRT